MGMQLVVYVGTYLKVRVEKTQAPPVYHCVDHPGRNSVRAEFCPACGKALTEISPQFSLPHISDLIPDGADEFMQPSMDDKDHIFLLCNLYSRFKPSHIDTDDADEIELTAHTIEQFTLNFISHHKESIEKLRNLPECNGMSVNFGVVQYYT